MLGSPSGTTTGTKLHGTVHQIIDQLVIEERDSGPVERRTAHRQALTRPVLLRPLNDPEKSWQAFSKNVSPHGIGLITHERIELGTIAKLTIYRPAGPPVDLLAECRWCDPFGDDWFLHGWNFINVARTN
jgi:hypothetical protein